MSFLVWNPKENSDEVNARWAQLRSLEWSSWPLFISQSIAPILLIFFPWPSVAIGVIAANGIWAIIRHQFVSVALATIGTHLSLLKLVICPAAAVYLLFQGNYVPAGLALLWPFIVLLIPSFPGARLGIIESLFMQKLGYARAGTGA